MYIHNLDPVALQIGSFAIRWYSLAYIFGILLSFEYILFLNRKLNLGFTDKKDMEDLTFKIIIGIILGGRLGYIIFYNFSYYLDNPVQTLYIWQGGMSFHGGLIGLTLSVLYHAKKHNKSFLKYMDLIACSTPIGLFLGRIANFINGELYGKTTNVSWGVIFPDAGPLARHPSQLYEAFLEGIVTFIILYITARKTSLLNSNGKLAGLFLICYGLFRTIVELYRIPDQHIGYIFKFITTGQILSIPMILLGIYLISAKQKFSSIPDITNHKSSH